MTTITKRFLVIHQLVVIDNVYLDSNKLNHNLNNDTFNKIDNELEKLQENKLPRKEENKDRSCVRCIVF